MRDWRQPTSDALHFVERHIVRTLLSFSAQLPLSVTMMRRDRLFLVATLTALFTADLYFILLPKLQSVGRGSEHLCTCGPDNLSLPGHGGLATPQLSNWTLLQHMDGTTSEPTDWGSKLERLFAHALYNIQTPVLLPEERLLGAEQLLEYYRRKVSRWERSVSGIVFFLGLKTTKKNPNILDLVFFSVQICFDFAMAGKLLNVTLAVT